MSFIIDRLNVEGNAISHVRPYAFSTTFLSQLTLVLVLHARESLSVAKARQEWKVMELWIKVTIAVRVSEVEQSVSFVAMRSGFDRGQFCLAGYA